MTRGILSQRLSKTLSGVEPPGSGQFPPVIQRIAGIDNEILSAIPNRIEPIATVEIGVNESTLSPGQRISNPTGQAAFLLREH